MNGEEGETPPTEGAAGAMDPPPDAGEGNPAPSVAPTVSGQQHKTNHNRVKLSDLIGRIELLEKSHGQGPSASVPESKVEVLSDAKESDEHSAGTSSVSGTREAETPTDAGSGAVSGAVDDLLDALPALPKPFKGLRLGSWNYGRKPK